MGLMAIGAKAGLAKGFGAGGQQAGASILQAALANEHNKTMKDYHGQKLARDDRHLDLEQQKLAQNYLNRALWSLMHDQNGFDRIEQLKQQMRGQSRQAPGAPSGVSAIVQPGPTPTMAPTTPVPALSAPSQPMVPSLEEPGASALAYRPQGGDDDALTA